MQKNRKHIKLSKGERLHWVNVSGDENSVVYRVTLDSRFLKPVRVSETRNSKVALNTNLKFLVP